jgi:hypothetical protein
VAQHDEPVRVAPELARVDHLYRLAERGDREVELSALRVLDSALEMVLRRAGHLRDAGLGPGAHELQRVTHEVRHAGEAGLELRVQRARLAVARVEFQRPLDVPEGAHLVAAVAEAARLAHVLGEELAPERALIERPGIGGLRFGEQFLDLAARLPGEPPDRHRRALVHVGREVVERPGVLLQPLVAQRDAQMDFRLPIAAERRVAQRLAVEADRLRQVALDLLRVAGAKEQVVRGAGERRRGEQHEERRPHISGSVSESALKRRRYSSSASRSVIPAR